MLRQSFCVTGMPVARPIPLRPVALSGRPSAQGFPWGLRVILCRPPHCSKPDGGEQFRKQLGLCHCRLPLTPLLQDPCVTGLVKHGADAHARSQRSEVVGVRGDPPLQGSPCDTEVVTNPESSGLSHVSL